jgi:aryl-alcohol dehydrogenase-like predicted oxidoreductase
MNKRKLGRTNLHVSELCLNTTKFGWINDEASSFDLLDTYYTCGGSFLQSLGFCPNSAAAQAVQSDSDSEDIVGRWRATRGINRDGLVLATRMSLFRPAHGGSIAFANLIREACERSLRRLRTTHIDLLICDWDKHLLPIDDVLEAVDMLIRAGVVRYAVAGGFPPWRVVDSLHRSRVRDHARFEALQGEYSLMTRARFEAEALSMCREHRLGFVARSPLAGGFLAKRPASIRELIHLDRTWQDERFGNNAGDAILSTLAEIADKRLATPAQIAFAWVLRDPAVTSALVTAVSPRELRDLVRAASIILSDQETGVLANVTTVQDYRMELRHA